MTKRAIYASALEHVTRTEGLLSRLREAEIALTEARKTLSTLLLNGFDGESEEEPTKEEQVAATRRCRKAACRRRCLGTR